jgi:small basic protein (TIGR04137 family)
MFFGLPEPDIAASLRARARNDPAGAFILPTMSKHPSLKASATVGGKRSVLKRFERVKLLRERGEWKAGRTPLGLPKTKHEV